MRQLAFIGTGGTIASLGIDALDLLDYGATGNRVDAAELLTRTGLASAIVPVRAIDFRNIDSTAITSKDWADLADLCTELACDTEVGGVVIGHGTASLEETAWALSLTLDLRIPVVLTGSMRPLSGISSDAGANLAAAMRVAAFTASNTGGVYVVANDEIHDPAEVTKSHTLRVDTFRSPEFGPLGRVEGADVRFTRAVSGQRPHFDRALLRLLPRVDVAYSHVSADGCAIDAFVNADARGIVSAGFGPGQGTPDELKALDAAVQKGVVVVQSSRTGSGTVVDAAHLQSIGVICGGALNPQKARILLALCLARGDDRSTIARAFQLS